MISYPASRVLSVVENASKVGLSTAMLLFSVQVSVLAQDVAPEPTTSQTASPVRAFEAPSQPDLPPLQPTLPNALETRLVLKLGDRRVYVYQGDTLKASYRVAVGRPGWETPVGHFQVLEMVQNPGWTNPFTREVVPPGPDSPLGARWIAFWTDGHNYVGFHGTPDRDTVGRAASHGCIRMFNEDVRKLYDLVKVGTSVTVER